MYCARRSNGLPGASATEPLSELMPSLPPTHRARGAGAYERERKGARARLYDWRWEQAAKAHLAAHPLCAYHALEGRVCAAELVDHLYPHRGDAALFWRREWWVPSCRAYHSGPKQAAERAGAAALDALALRLGAPLKRG